MEVDEDRQFRDVGLCGMKSTEPPLSEITTCCLERLEADAGGMEALKVLQEVDLGSLGLKLLGQ